MGSAMSKILSLVIAALCLCLHALVASAGGTVVAPIAQFDTFTFSAVGPIDGSQQTAQLATTFGVGPKGPFDPSLFSLSLSFSGPGAPATEIIPGTTLSSICTDPPSLYLCSYSSQFTFMANGPIQPGATFGATGEILFLYPLQSSPQPLSPPVTATDSFVATTPEPSALALIAIGLFGLGVARRKAAR
jgi:PEP-CTERM motif